MWVHVQLDSPNDGIGADWSKAGDLEFYGAENRAGNVSSGAAGFFGEQTRRTSGAYTCALLSLRSRYATRLNAGCVGTTQLPHVRRVEEWFRIKRATDFGRVAQLVRAPASHAGGRRFESCRAHHSNEPLAATLHRLVEGCTETCTEGMLLSVVLRLFAASNEPPLIGHCRQQWVSCRNRPCWCPLGPAPASWPWLPPSALP